MLNSIFKSIGVCFALTFALSSLAATIDEAKALYRDGNFYEAAEILESIVKKSPRDGNANYYMGASLYELGKTVEAIPYLKVAAGRNVTDASRLLALCSLQNYSADEAADYMANWEAALKKAKKQLPEEFSYLSNKILNMRNMLDRVEKIEIVDTLTVDSVDFFKFYKLSEAAGRILPPDVINRLGATDTDAEVSVAFAPETNTEIFWSETDSTGVFKLRTASILDDGTIESAYIVGDDLGEGGNAKFPFMMPDGSTLYFANNGENSIGGYDIFMTRRNSDGIFYQPQNLGMPFNSTANDYMLAIDEVSGLGWFASDRNSQQGKVTIYIFVPSNIRVNVEPNDDNLIELAKLDDISLTQSNEVDYQLLLKEKLPQENVNHTTDNKQRFFLDLGNGKVYTRLSEFKQSAAKSAMLEAMACEADIRQLTDKVEKLRDRYRDGDKSLNKEIIELERKIDKTRAQYKSLRNKTIRLEK